MPRVVKGEIVVIPISKVLSEAITGLTTWGPFSVSIATRNGKYQSTFGSAVGGCDKINSGIEGGSFQLNAGNLWWFR